MRLVIAFLAGIAGATLAEAWSGLFGFIGGALIALIWTRQTAVEKDNKALEHRIEDLEVSARVADREHAASIATARSETPVAKETVKPAVKHPPLELGASLVRAARDMKSQAADRIDTTTAPPMHPEQDIADKVVSAGRRWLSTGNVPVKLGVLVSFFGVAFLLKYAVDRQIVVISIEMRYLLVAMGSAFLFHMGWRLRAKMRVYALSLQGGGIGALYLTIFAAFRLHPILPAPVAFFLLVILTVGIGWLAVRQNALILAMLGTVGGFLAPLLISTGSGNHVALFGYYLLLNCGVLGIAWHKAWRELNILGFIFTFGVGTIWGSQYYRPEHFASTEPFLVAFFLFYHAIAILFAFRQPPKLRGLVDGTLVFGTPGVAFALQAKLLENSEYGLAISAAIIAVMYAVTALWLYRLKIDKMRLLIESYFSLAVAFATIAIPLALDDRWTAIAWALEGGALIWVGVRQSRFLSKISGTVLLFGGGVEFMAAGWTHDLGMPILNGNVFSGVLIGVLSMLSAYRLAADENKVQFQSIASFALLVWGLGWWLATGTAEINDRVPGDLETHLLTLFFAATAIGMAVIANTFDWMAARRITLVYLPSLALPTLAYLVEFNHLFSGIGGLVWLFAIAAHFVVMWQYGESNRRVVSVWHYIGGMLFAGFLSHELFWRIDQLTLNDVWSASGAMFLMTAIALAISYGRKRIAWPLQQHAQEYMYVAISLVVLQLLTLIGAGIDDPGNPAPLPYIPLLNPFDLLTVFGLGVAWYGLQPGKAMSRILGRSEYQLTILIWGFAAFVLSTIAVVRGVHHFGDIPWQQQELANSVLVQSSLSIYWAILGLTAMTCGARRAHRLLWMIGAGLMVLVVAKLFLIDLGNSGTVERIISFLGVGAMLMLVGYYAPAPPKSGEA